MTMSLIQCPDASGHGRKHDASNVYRYSKVVCIACSQSTSIVWTRSAVVQNARWNSARSVSSRAHTVTRGQSLGNQYSGAWAPSIAQTAGACVGLVRGTCGANRTIEGSSLKWYTNPLTTSAWHGQAGLEPGRLDSTRGAARRIGTPNRGRLQVDVFRRARQHRVGRASLSTGDATPTKESIRPQIPERWSSLVVEPAQVPIPSSPPGWTTRTNSAIAKSKRSCGTCTKVLIDQSASNVESRNGS